MLTANTRSILRAFHPDPSLHAIILYAIDSLVFSFPRSDDSVSCAMLKSTVLRKQEQQFAQLVDDAIKRAIGKSKASAINQSE